MQHLNKAKGPSMIATVHSLQPVIVLNSTPSEYRPSRKTAHLSFAQMSIFARRLSLCHTAIHFAFSRGRIICE